MLRDMSRMIAWARVGNWSGQDLTSTDAHLPTMSGRVLPSFSLPHNYSFRQQGPIGSEKQRDSNAPLPRIAEDQKTRMLTLQLCCYDTHSAPGHGDLNPDFAVSFFSSVKQELL